MSVEGRRVSLRRLYGKLGFEPPKGTDDLFVNRICSPSKVQNPCAVVASEEKHLEELSDKPLLLVVEKGLFPRAEKKGIFVLGVENPKLALALLLEEVYPEEHPVGVSELAVVEEGVSLGKDVFVGPFAFVGRGAVLEDGVKVYPGAFVGPNARIGAGSVIYPNAVVMANAVIGRGVRIHPGAVVGKEGFGFVFDGREHRRLRHAGLVVIEDGAEVGANSCVDRALLDETVVGEGSKIDNLVQVAHNDRLGRGVILVSQVGLSGSVEVGDYSVLAGQVGVADHVKIGKGVKVVAKSGVTKDLEDGKTYGAVWPAVEWSRWKRLYALFMRLPKLLKREK
ncbi:MAG: UDP-3-O-(3-hydroxymyristoyl)glucosamine N-acyltransferase [Aquificae bacterium]|nr:UDP-3-O-(3-hydroxymyristoyl)glucosamine N-acyltransferase [Aquificota bacterium]